MFKLISFVKCSHAYVCRIRLQLAVIYSDNGATGFIFVLRLVSTNDVLKDVYYLVW